MTKEERREYDKNRRRKKATEISKYKRSYYTANSEEIKAKNLAYYYAHREKRIEQMRVYNRL